ncbi:hypothetical protein NQ152_12050 [Microbacterium sp. zg.B48]|uniref:hypothetical protein n=1 Tax=Microbacterium sp. zg.B48 TaxID=2969408 RepID=UPI00214B5BF8|nr:hypothetical protein [Microbacterium sp. zg.B48]MCR2764236.1 hypothetical protein [Microbacterium sp. zg.B48]
MLKGGAREIQPRGRRRTDYRQTTSGVMMAGKRWGNALAPILSVASQGIGVGQLILLLARVGANDATDVYLYLFNMGMLPTQIVTVGVVFPMLLNRERITARLARLIRRWIPFVGSGFVLLAAFWMALNGRLEELLLPIVAASVVNAFLQARVWIRAIGAEAAGDPNWISGIAIPANVLAVGALLLPLPTPELLIFAMVSALAVANLGLLVFMTVRKVGDKSFSELPVSRLQGSRAETWFLTKAGVSYGGLAVIQSMAVLLPPAVLTILSVAAKIVASLVATFVNAVMPRVIHRESSSLRPSMRFLSFLYIGAAVVGAGIVGFAAVFGGELLLPAVCVALWVVGAVANSVAQRTAYRFLPPNASRITISIVPIVAVLTVASTLSPNFQLATLLCAYAAVDASTGALLLAALKEKLNAVVAGMAVIAISCLWVLSLL